MEKLRNWSIGWYKNWYNIKWTKGNAEFEFQSFDRFSVRWVLTHLHPRRVRSTRVQAYARRTWTGLSLACRPDVTAHGFANVSRYGPKNRGLVISKGIIALWHSAKRRYTGGGWGGAMKERAVPTSLQFRFAFTLLSVFLSPTFFDRAIDRSRTRSLDRFSPAASSIGSDRLFCRKWSQNSIPWNRKSSIKRERMYLRSIVRCFCILRWIIS